MSKKDMNYLESCKHDLKSIRKVQTELRPEIWTDTQTESVKPDIRQNTNNAVVDDVRIKRHSCRRCRERRDFSEGERSENREQRYFRESHNRQCSARGTHKRVAAKDCSERVLGITNFLERLPSKRSDPGVEMVDSTYSDSSPCYIADREVKFNGKAKKRLKYRCICHVDPHASPRTIRKAMKSCDYGCTCSRK